MKNQRPRIPDYTPPSFTHFPPGFLPSPGPQLGRERRKRKREESEGGKERKWEEREGYRDEASWC